MKANELRIGNYVRCKSNSEILPVEEILSSGVFFANENLITIYDHIEPVSLTPEILIKYGFESTMHDDKYQRYELNIKGIDFMFEIIGMAKPDFYLCMVGVDILYLHQLQNLYFALTGTELEIKL